MRRYLQGLAWLTVFYTVLVSIWGVWVRVSGSGDGCGDHWPLCNGEVIPTSREFQTMIEYVHRISTAIYGILVLLQLVLVWISFKSSNTARFWSAAVFVFTIIEAGIGAILVKAELVDQSRDLLRLIVMPLHLVNTIMLLSAAVFCALFVSNPDSQLTINRHQRVWFVLLVASFLLLTTSGAIASLGSQLAQSDGLVAGFFEDFNNSAHLATRLRILHPILALVLGITAVISSFKLAKLSNNSSAEVWAARFVTVFFVGILVGFLTLVTLAPIWLKLVHVTFANLLVFVLSVLIFSCFCRNAAEK